MPAKKEYLSSPGQRTLKITAGFIGGYFLAISLQMAIGVIIPYRTEVLLTGVFSIFILWVAFIVLAFLARNGWIIWGIYLLAISVFAGIIYLFK